MRRILIGGVVVLILIVAGYFIFQATQGDEAPPTPSVDVNTIAIDTGVSAVSAEGRIVPLEFTALSFQLSGELAEVMAAEGSSVAAGDPILRLVDDDQRLAVDQTRAAVVQAEANLQTAQAAISLAEAGLEAARVGVEAAEAQLALVASGATAGQVALSEAQLAAAEAGIAQAAGQRAASLEAATSAQIQAAEAQLAAAEAALVPLQIRVDQYARGDISGSEEEKRAAQLELNAAIANVRAAEAALSEARAGAGAPERLAANSAVAVATANRDASAAQLDLLLAGARDEEIAVAQTGVEQARSGVVEAELALSQAEGGITQAEAGLEEARAALAATEAALEKTVLRAPFKGTVADISLDIGEIVVSGTPVVTLADLSEWRVETTDLTELNIVAVARDFPVDVMIDAFPGETLRGRVIDISPVSDIVLGDVTYKVTIDLDDDDALPLRWGMTAFVTIDVEE